MTPHLRRGASACALIAFAVVACAPANPGASLPGAATSPAITATPPDAAATPVPVRTSFPPGQVFDYVAQSGDTLPAVASHFNTTVEEILQANPDLPEVSTLPVGYVLAVPAYYLPLTGPAFHILPDSEIVNGPTAVSFSTQEEILKRPGFLSGLSDYAFRRERPAWEVIDVVARNYSIHPRLLLTLLEYQTQALSRPFPDSDQTTYPLAVRNTRFRGLYRQLIWAAEQINDGYYGWRAGSLKEYDLADGKTARPDSWLNAGTAGLQMLFATMYGEQEFARASSPDGFFAAYVSLWGDPAQYAIDLLPGSLQQPELALPFLPNRIWDFTGGPHSSWGESLPLGALDFAPPAMEGGCAWSGEWVAAPAAGVITRSEEAIVELDLDGDGDARTGWVIFFFHIAEQDRIPAGTVVAAGDRLGHPSCEGGRSTGTHFHIARRFQGEWLPAAGPLPFILDGWVPENGAEPYLGTMTRGSRSVEACTCTTAGNRIIYTLPGEQEP
jgi:LysM repeat protein